MMRRLIICTLHCLMLEEWSGSTHSDEKCIKNFIFIFRRQRFGVLGISGTVALEYVIKRQSVNYK